MRIRSIFFASVGSLAAATAMAAVDVEGVYEDAKVIRRVAEVSRGELPRDILRTLAERNVDELRGKLDNGTFEYARYEAIEAGRVADRFTLKKAKIEVASPDAPPAEDSEPLTEVKLSGDRVYRALLSVPSRRMLVSRNQKVFVDRIEATWSSYAGGEKTATIPIGEWIDVGRERQVNMPEITRSAKVSVFARMGGREGTSSLDVALLQATLVDRPDSPYAAPLRQAKELVTAIQKNDASATRRLAGSIVADLEPRLRRVDPVATPARPRAAEEASPVISPVPETQQEVPSLEIYMELEAVEDLLTGTEAERREGLDRLHQLVRKLRPRKHFDENRH